MEFLQVDQGFELNKSGLWVDEKGLLREVYASTEWWVSPLGQGYETIHLNPNWGSE
jgi:hypothetical protein